MKSFLRNYLVGIVFAVTLVGLILDFLALTNNNASWPTFWFLATCLFGVETVAGFLLYIHYGLITRDLVPAVASQGKQVMIHLGIWIGIAEVWILHIIAYYGSKADSGSVAALFIFATLAFIIIDLMTYCFIYRRESNQMLLPY